MTTMSATSQYATGSARERIERALQATGKSVDSLNENDLAPIEHFHTLGLRATESLVELAGITTGDRVLDAGGGVGALEAKSGCRRLLRGRVLVSQSLTHAAEDFLGERLVVDRACERE